MKPPRVLFIAIDAGDQHLARAWAEAGELPVLAELFRTALRARTRGPEGFFVGAIWPSFYTSVNPARHGCHCWEQLEVGTYDVTRFRAGEHLACDAFWDVLGRAGKQAAIIDVPLSGPARDIQGLQIIEWGCHDPELGFCTVPPELARTLPPRLGMHPVQGGCNHRGRSAEDLAQLRDDLVHGAGMKTALNLALLKERLWDVFLTVYSEAHCAGHQLWHVHDPSHPRHDAGVARALGDPVRDVYRAIDRGVGRLLAGVGPDTVVFVWLSHGMGPKYSPTFALDEYLRRLELATSGTSLDAPRSALRFFHHSNNHVEAGIRINLADREPQGRVAAGDEFEAVCAELTRELHTLVDLDTGAPLVRHVLRTRNLYRGSLQDRLPDLVVQWEFGGPPRRIGSPRTGELLARPTTVRTGDHHPDGLVFVRGPGLSGGVLDGCLDVMDFAPTIAALVGVDLPNVEGRAIAPILAAVGTT